MQGKIKLNLDELAIDSFDTAADGKGEGTVFAEQCTCLTQCEGSCVEWSCRYTDCGACTYTGCGPYCG